MRTEVIGTGFHVIDFGVSPIVCTPSDVNAARISVVNSDWTLRLYAVRGSSSLSTPANTYILYVYRLNGSEKGLSSSTASQK
jgi:hypothetical protein